MRRWHAPLICETARVDRAWLFSGRTRFLSYFLDANALDEVISALEIVCAFAVVLDEKRGGFECLPGGLDCHEDVGLADLLSRHSANNHLPTSFLPNQTNVFDCRFSAVARTADGPHLHLVRGVEIFEASFHFDARAGRVLDTDCCDYKIDASSSEYVNRVEL